MKMSCYTTLLLLAMNAPNPLMKASLSAAELPVLPAVQTWTAGEGLLELKDAVLRPPPGPRSDDRSALLEAIAEDWKALTGKELPVLPVKGSHPGGGIVLQLTPGPERSEAYELNCNAEGVVIRAASETGLFYGTRVLLQLLQASGEAMTLPQGVIKDEPTSDRRMLMLDTGRKFFPVDLLKDYMRAMAWLRMNELHLHLSDEAFGGEYTGFRVQCDTFPGLTSKDGFYSRKELRDLQDFARVRGITITPEIDMPGHATVFTDYWPDLLMPGQKASYMDVTHPNTIQRMQQLLDEMIPLFDAPDFHIGTDEYRVSGSVEERTRLHEGFRQFINTMNAHVRSHGKNTRIWSGFEHMLGSSEIDPTVTIDMWETDDARAQIARGHHVINSNHGRTYIVPGAHYYGVSNAGVYQGWEPWMVSGKMDRNPKPDDPNLLGGKLHVWNDQGPTGYTHCEIADLTMPSLMAFAEKMWGVKGSPDYATFQKRAALVGTPPGLSLLDRLPAAENGLVLEHLEEVQLKTPEDRVALPLAAQARKDLEYPWTLVMEVKKTAPSAAGAGVILSSDLVEICDHFSRTDQVKRKDPETGKEIREKVTQSGMAVVRAAGSAGAYPAASKKTLQVSQVYAPSLPQDEWVTLAIVGQRRHTELFINGKSVGKHREQMVCPLAYIGGSPGRSLVGSLRNLRVWDRALRSRELARLSGVDLPENYAYQASATASAWHAGYPLQPAHLTDEKPQTRWSSGSTRAPQWVQLDLGQHRKFSRAHLVWEAAYAKKFNVQVADQPEGPWRKVGEGQGKVGPVTLSFDKVSARYVRINMSDAATGWGYSLYEVEIWP